jgi:hypothetical protein
MRSEPEPGDPAETKYQHAPPRNPTLAHRSLPPLRDIRPIPGPLEVIFRLSKGLSNKIRSHPPPFAAKPSDRQPRNARIRSFSMLGSDIGRPLEAGPAPRESLIYRQRPGPVAIRDMHFFLFEGPAHLSRQFVEKVTDSAIIKIARVLREDLPGENGNRLAVACGFTSGSGIEDFAAGKHPR